MKRTICLLALAVLLTACSAAQPPVQPEQPGCVRTPKQDPIDGGIGGTGRGTTAPCKSGATGG